MTLIDLRDVAKIYDLGAVQVVALKGATFTIEQGEYVALMGASGSGKSTLMNTLGCLDRPTSGSYRLAGEEIATMSRDERARIRNDRIGFVFQSFNLLARTSAVENVELPLLYGQHVSGRERRQRAQELLQRVGLGDRFSHHTSQLSGGQQQRVAVARALASRPEVILADEPTGNLDSATSVEIMRVFGSLHAQGQTVILVTHEPDIAAHAHRVVVLRDGKVDSDRRNESPVREAAA